MLFLRLPSRKLFENAKAKELANGFYKICADSIAAEQKKMNERGWM
jgi:hypothetical protein